MTKREHWSGNAGQLRTNWDLFKRYDVLDGYAAGVEVQTADKKVSDNMQKDANFLKYMQKLSGKTDPAPEAGVAK